ncbi:MAG TPA: anthranilate synthase component I family protein, partial [Bacteroidales bacterium]|nr:anthranilate synthase component I family protein [Bacteroidales bacterium]
MKRFYFNVVQKKILADTITPVGLYLKFRDIYPGAVLLESSDFHGSKGSYSFICLKPLSTFEVKDGKVQIGYPDGSSESMAIASGQLPEILESYRLSFQPNTHETPANGLFGYLAYDAVRYAEHIAFPDTGDSPDAIPEVSYSFYKYIIAINHFQNALYLIENLFDGEDSQLPVLESLPFNRNFATYPFQPDKK